MLPVLVFYRILAYAVWPEMKRNRLQSAAKNYVKMWRSVATTQDEKCRSQ